MPEIENFTNGNDTVYFTGLEFPAVVNSLQGNDSINDFSILYFNSGTLNTNTIHGGQGNDTIIANANDVIYGDKGNDLLESGYLHKYVVINGGGTTEQTGVASPTFAFADNSGQDTIIGWHTGDKIQIEKNINGSDITSFTTLNITALPLTPDYPGATVMDGGYLVHLTHGNNITIQEIAISQANPLISLHASDFVFV